MSSLSVHRGPVIFRKHLNTCKSPLSPFILNYSSLLNLPLPNFLYSRYTTVGTYYSSPV